MEFSRPEYWSGQPFPSPGDLLNPGIEPGSPELQADSLPTEPSGKQRLTLYLFSVGWAFTLASTPLSGRQFQMNFTPLLSLLSFQEKTFNFPDY